MQLKKIEIVVFLNLNGVVVVKLLQSKQHTCETRREKVNIVVSG